MLLRPLSARLNSQTTCIQSTFTREYHRHPNRAQRWHKSTRDQYLHGMTDGVTKYKSLVSERQFPLVVDWSRPKHPARWTPGADSSGDCEGLPDVDLKRPVLAVRGNEHVLENVRPEIKKLFSLEYARNKDVLQTMMDDLKKELQDHKFDEKSLEDEIIKATVYIRYFQKKGLQTEPRNPGFTRKNPQGHLKNVTKILVDVRRCKLAALRSRDYKKFEYLLEKLNLVYKPRPLVWERVERKACLERMADIYCEEMKEYKLNEVKESFEAKLPDHFRQKAETLRWIQKEEEELGLPSSVKEEEIEKALKMAEEYQARKEKTEAKTREEKSQKFISFEPEVVQEIVKH